MKLHFDPTLFVVWLLACALLGGLLWWLAGMPFWLAGCISAAALFITGVVAEVEDRSPGGFLNPRKKPK